MALFQGRVTRAVVNTSAQILEMQYVQLPPLTPGSVLIQVHYMPVHAWDWGRTCGYEGAGVVVECGNNAKKWLHKSVLFITYSGTWSEYAVADTRFCVVLPNFSSPLATSLLRTPLMVCMFGELISIGKHKSILQTNAASPLGKMITRYCLSNNITCLSLVDGEEDLEIARLAGARNLLLTSVPEFQDLLQKTVSNLKVSCAFDGSGGELTNIVLEALTDEAELFIYRLRPDHEITSLNVSAMVLGGKRCQGLSLDLWLSKLRPGDLKSIIAKIQRNVGVYRADVSAEFSFSDIQNASEAALSSPGIVLIRIRKEKPGKEIDTDLNLADDGPKLSQEDVAKTAVRHAPSVSAASQPGETSGFEVLHPNFDVLLQGVKSEVAKIAFSPAGILSSDHEESLEAVPELSESPFV